MAQFVQIATTASDEVFVLDAAGVLWRYYWAHGVDASGHGLTSERKWERIERPEPETP